MLILASLATGCERPDHALESRGSPTRAVDVVIARAGDEVIGASDVVERMRTSGLDRRAALDQLIDEALLVDEARKRGLGESEIERRAVERAMVRRMLRDFEAELSPDAVPMKDVRDDFETYRARFQVPERRESWHILVRSTSDDAKSMAESILREVKRSSDPKDVYERYANSKTETEFDVIAEELPAITRSAGLEQPYKDALFDANRLGLLDDPVETAYGWHVIVLTEILPGETRTLDDVQEEIRERLSKKMRFQRVVDTVDQLEAQGLVEYDDEGVDRLLSMSGLPTRGE